MFRGVRSHVRGVQGPGGGAAQVEHAAGLQPQRDRGHVAAGAGGEDGAQEVHEGHQEVQPGRHLPPAVRQTLRQPSVTRSLNGAN